MAALPGAPALEPYVMPQFLIGTPGMGELLVILFIVVLVFGASRLPQLGEGVGKAIRNLKRGLNENDDIDVTPTSKQVEEGATAARDEVAEADLVDR